VASDYLQGDVVIGDKEERFQGKGTDFGALQSQVEGYLKDDHFKVQTSAPGPHGAVIQAKKGGFLRDAVDAERALTIKIEGSPEDFTVRVGIGKWLENLGVMAVETLVISDLFLVVDVADSAWNFEVEDKVFKKIKSFVG
jgi:hypothetical protein